jgi:hypothetical protein
MSRFQHVLALVGALGLSHCHKDHTPARATQEPLAAAAAASSANAAPSPSSAPMAAAVAEASANPMAALSEWLEASLYQFKASTIRPCPASASSNGGAPSASPRLGITVQIKAKVDSLLASPRDITLERDGVILQAELNPSAACGAPLPTKQLRRGETALGLVLFDLPDANFAQGSVLRFKPTRWGGAPAVAVEIPNCLSDCPPKRTTTTH